MLVGERLHVRPEGDTCEVRATVLANPLTGATVIVEVPMVPAVVVTVVRLALMVKSVTVYVTIAEWLIDPLVPVTVTS